MRINMLINKCVRHTKWVINSVCGFYRFKKILNRSSCVFISHNGDSAGGAPVVLFELMRTLKEEHMIFLCEKPGGIINQCGEEHIPAFCTYLLQNKYLEEIKKAKVKAVIVNTLAAYNSIQFFNSKDTNIPVLWWVHEERGLIERYSSKVPLEINKKIHILCVSSSVETDLLELCPQCEGYTNILYYGCKDLFNGKHEYNKNKDNFVISVIGRICKRKNQMQIIEAYKNLPSAYRKKIYIYFISASCDKNYKKEMIAAIGEDTHFKFEGPIKRENMPRIYEQSALIVCPSIDDPLPVVVTEALMLMCPVITSSRTGQFSIIKDGVNAFSYEVDSVKQLCQKIQKVYDTDDLTAILREGRETYLQYFSPDVVNRNFTKYLKQAIGEANSD